MKRIIFIILLSSLLLSNSCKKNEELPTSSDVHERLYDKLWYCADNNLQEDHFFNSDGTYVIPPSSGTYQWKSNDTMVLYDPTSLTTTKIWFTILEDSNIAYWPTWEPEGVRYRFTSIK